MTDLSPQAQAVWDAYELVDCDPYKIDPRKAGLAAALRAAALYCKRDRLQLIAIASEFDSQENNND